MTMTKLAISIACVAMVSVMPEPRSTSHAPPTSRMATTPWTMAEMKEMTTPRFSSISLAIM
jgi:hypothetical protein